MARKIGKRQTAYPAPLLLFDTKEERRQLSYNMLSSDTKGIMECVYEMDRKLKGIKGLSASRRGKLVLMTEENCMDIAEQNQKKETDIEVSVIVPENAADPFVLIIRNSEGQSNLIDETDMLSSFREYMISAVLSTSQKSYFMTNKSETAISFRY